MVSNARQRRQRVPRMVTSNNSTFITGAEAIGSVSVGTTGQSKSFCAAPYSPGIADTWLQQQAMLYNKYRYTRLALRYTPFTSTSTSGRVIIGWSPDSSDKQPPTANLITQYQNAVETPVWKETRCNFQMPRKNEFIISEDNCFDPASNVGGFMVGADQGSSSTNQGVGTLYIEYTIELWDRVPPAVQ